MSSNKSIGEFGFLRLFFAALVIVSHTPELYDGNRNREALTWMFHSVSFGELAVDAFFIISGYLISLSFLRDPSVFQFVKKRIARIYPAYLAAFAICVFVLAPFAGEPNYFTHVNKWKAVLSALLLMPPASGFAFHGTFYPELNGAMWTISYEFKCYIAVMLLGLFGLLSNRRVILILTALMLFASVLLPVQYHPFGYQVAANNHPHGGFVHAIAVIVGKPATWFRLMGMYLCGVLYAISREHVLYTKRGLCISGIGMLLGLMCPSVVNIFIAIMGGYVIFASARIFERSLLFAVNKNYDISYGVYLYAWPIEKMIYWYFPSIGLIFAGVSTFIAACLMGVFSWFFLEKPVMSMVRQRGSHIRAPRKISTIPIASRPLPPVPRVD